MKMKSLTSCVIVLALNCWALLPARAGSVIFSNLRPGDSYGSTGWTLGNPFTGDFFVVGSSFTSSGNFNLATIEVAASFVSGTNRLFISLEADAGGSPGALIESFTVDDAMPTLGTVTSGHLVTATSLLHPLLTAGTQYWVALGVPHDGTWAAWNLNSTGDTGAMFQNNHGSVPAPFTDTRGAIRISAESIPEPSAFVLAGAAACLTIGYRLRRRSSAKGA
jgi:hypothetical protein